MFEHSDSDATLAEETLRRVQNPEGFVEAFRNAHRDEQVRRRQFVDELSPDVKAEWIDGEAVYHSPAREAHNVATAGLASLLDGISLRRVRLRVRIEKAMVELERDNFEPDLCVWLASDHTFDGSQVTYPRPDLAIEVLSQRSADRDLNKKKRAYAAAGCHEYWVVDADRHTVLQFRNENGQFSEAKRFTQGEELLSLWRAEIRFPVHAIFDDDVRNAWWEDVVFATRSRG